MNDPALRQIASDISIISVALLGVTFILLSIAWRGFIQHWLTMPREQRRPLVRVSFIMILPILLPIGVASAVGAYWPTLAQSSVMLVMMLLAVIATIYILFSGFRKLYKYLLKKQGEPVPIKLDGTAIVYSYSLILLAIAVFCNAFALLGTINTAMDMYISPFQPENFNFARWLLIDAVLFFVSGMFATGYAYLDEKSSEWVTAKTKEQARDGKGKEMNAKQKMEEAYKIWVFSWLIWHSTKSGKLDYSQLPSNFSIESENGAITFQTNIPATEREKLAINGVITTTGVCFTAFDSALDDIFGKGEKSNPVQTTGLLAARIIVNQIRNAYAHDPIHPKWHVQNPNHQKTFQINEIDLTVNLRELNGKDFKVEQINGSVGVAKLLNYCLNNVKENKS